MDINRDNYEAYFLDFAEGRLSAEQEELLYRFLKFNPDLADEMELLEIQPLQPGTEVCPSREKLKMVFPGKDEDITDANFDMYCIARLENDLQPEEEERLDKYLEENPLKQVDYKYYQSTKLIKKEIPFPGKSHLKKHKTRTLTAIVRVSFATAAAVLLFLLFGPALKNPVSDIASTADPVEEKQSSEETVGNEKSEPKTASPTLNLIRKTSNPVPASTYKKPPEKSGKEQAGHEMTDQNDGGSGRIAGMQLKKASFADLNDAPYDRIRSLPISPPSINKSSLSVLELARYRAQKASEIISDEDVSILSLANSGLKELNRLTGTEAEILASRDEDGSISGIQFKSRILNFTTPISRDQ